MDSDEALIRQWQNGDSNAFETLVHRHTGSVYSFVRRLIGSVEDADDVTQTVFVNAWRALKKFKPEAKFTPWLFAIARNAATDYLRKKKSLPFSALSTEEYDFGDSLADTAPTQEEESILSESTETLDGVIQSLSPIYREVLLLRYQEGLTFEEIAEVLQISVNTAKSRGRRALQEIKRGMHPEDPLGRIPKQ